MSGLNIAIGIPTVGRSSTVLATLRHLAHQTRTPDRIIICVTQSTDVDTEFSTSFGASVIFANIGLPRQRNAVLHAVPEADVVIFFDDDFLPQDTYVQAVEQYLLANPQVLVVTGNVLVDGIKGRGLSAEDAYAVLANAPPHETVAQPTFAAYGCNMALRLAPIRMYGTQFDERLPLYAWQEDVDFCRRLAAFGDVVQLNTACGVHLGVKQGRGSGVRLGYSQVANPLYLLRKRAGYTLSWALSHMARNIASNLIRSIYSEPFIDRKGRLYGNMIAIGDALTGRLQPERILDL